MVSLEEQLLYGWQRVGAIDARWVILNACGTMLGAADTELQAWHAVLGCEGETRIVDFMEAVKTLRRLGVRAVERGE